VLPLGSQEHTGSEADVAGKGTRITVDLGREDLVKALRIAAVERSRTVRDIVVEALELWLAQGPAGARTAKDTKTASSKGEQSSDKDYVSMMETLNRYRGTGAD
jgi:hypothetical protein